jgi:hypothetical protein
MSESAIRSALRPDAQATLVAQAQALDSGWWTPQQVAADLGVTLGTLRNWRSENRGPAYHKLSPKLVRYQKDDVLRWKSRARVVPRD